MKQLLRLRVLAGAASAMGVLLAGCEGGEHGAQDRVQVVYRMNIDSIRASIDRWGFPEASETPNEYLSDFFGIQRLNDSLTADRVLSDLVPTYGTAMPDQPDGAVRVSLNWGPEAAFYFGAIVELSGKRTVPVSFVALNGPHGENLSELGEQFRGFLEQHGLAGAYLERNPYLEDERLAFETMHDATESITLDELPGFNRFLQEPNAVYILPDNVHGNQERYDQLMVFLEADEVDWVAIEMLEIGLQDELDALIDAAPGSNEYRVAETAIRAYYRRSWNDAFGLEEPEDNHYFAVLQRAKALGKRAYALDVALDYQLFRYGEFPLGGTTRNVIWARQIPATGRGLVFAGSAHMNLGQKGTFQYFLRRFHPELPIYHYYVDNPPN